MNLLILAELLVMKTINFIFFILLLITLTTQADDMIIVDVRSNIPLSDEEPAYMDYVINSKDVGSLKKNLVVLVKRNLKVKNADAKDIGAFETAVAQMKIIHVDNTIAIGREYKILPRDNDVTLDYLGAMTGDRIDTAGSFLDTKPMKKVAREPSNSSSGQKMKLELVPSADIPILLPEI